MKNTDRLSKSDDITLSRRKSIEVKWKSKTSNGDLVHYYAYPTTDVLGTPCVGLTILTLTKEPQKYFGGKVERIFFGKALYVVNEIHTLETYRTLTDAIDHILRVESRGQALGNGESKMSKYIDADKLKAEIERRRL